MAAPDIIRQLVERFEEHRASYRSGKYNEAQLRQEFLDPFFEALGWDIDQQAGVCRSLQGCDPRRFAGGRRRSPKPRIMPSGSGVRASSSSKPRNPPSISSTISYPAFQLRRYAWSAKLPLSILTDFEEFAVYESRSKPDKSDSAATGRVMLLNYKDYLSRWDEIAAIFSREAVLKGSFDKYAEGLKGKKGTTEVDDAFLEEIERWRDLLARNIALRNPDLQVRELNYAVQMTIDRIVFLRICEDRGIEREDQLQELLEGEGIYERLCQSSARRTAAITPACSISPRKKGQSSTPDDLTLRLQIDDKVLKEIISDLYYPAPMSSVRSPPTSSGRSMSASWARSSASPPGTRPRWRKSPKSARRAASITPPPISSITSSRIRSANCWKARPPRKPPALKILDPACGSGSFLLGAYQYLLDWHTELVFRA